MKVSYFEDTDTLYIEFRDSGIVESKDLDENTILDVDAKGNVCAITFEHASQRTDVSHLSGITSPPAEAKKAARLMGAVGRHH